MRHFLYNLSYKYQAFMQGRYGIDELNIFLLVASVVSLLLARTGVIFFFVFQILAWVLLIIALVRTYSRNISKRYEEKMKFLKLRNRFMAWYKIKRDAWQNRKTHKYFRCKKCKASIRVPKHVGKIEVTCPKCRYKFFKKV
ncbi:MAG: hypothetical protein J6D26_01405 [Clostridia bacterium]|nr:hypothetical protein [Clostridia bacterium]